MELLLDQISLALDDKLILNSCNLQIKAGELVALLGPSGCGKSTLLKTIAGLHIPHQGNIFVNGSNVENEACNKRGAVIVFQDLRLFPHMTAEENIAFPLKIQGMQKSERLHKARWLLERVQLGGYGNRKVHQMSGGQLQRVALARALAANPKILLLDEPFSSLDEGLRQDMRRLVLDLHREFAITTILVTHDYQEALMMASRIAVMLDGQIVQYDTPQHIFNNPVNKAVADYFGGGNYIAGEVTDGIFRSPEVEFPASASNGSYTALFRTSALKILGPEGRDRIIDMVYYGDKWEITVQTTSQELVLTTSGVDGLNIGDNVQIGFESSRAVLISNSIINGLVSRLN